jgi:hypothetical protein
MRPLRRSPDRRHPPIPGSQLQLSLCALRPHAGRTLLTSVGTGCGALPHRLFPQYVQIKLTLVGRIDFLTHLVVDADPDFCVTVTQAVRPKGKREKAFLMHPTLLEKTIAVAYFPDGDILRAGYQEYDHNKARVHVPPHTHMHMHTRLNYAHSWQAGTSFYDPVRPGRHHQCASGPPRHECRFVERAQLVPVNLCPRSTALVNSSQISSLTTLHAGLFVWVHLPRWKMLSCRTMCIPM